MRSYTIHLLFAALIMLIAPAVSLAQNPGLADFREGENLRKQGKCNEAIAKYDAALDKEPDNYKYYFTKGKCEYRMKEFEGAKQSFLKTVEYKPEYTPAYSLIAKLYRAEKDFENAIYYYEQAAKNEKNDQRKVQYKLLLVNLLLKEDRMYDARQHVEDARLLAPDNPNVMYYSGEMAAANERWEEAKGYYEAAVNSESLKDAPPAKTAKFYYGLGLALNNSGDSEGAKKAWSKANFGPYKKLIQREMVKSSHVYFYKIAVSYYLNGEYDEALVQLDKALEIQRDFSGGYMLKGKIENKRGDLSRSIDHFIEAAEYEKEPKKRARIYSIVATLQLKDNDPYRAIASLEQAMAGGQNPKLMFMKAQAEYGAGRYGDAIASLEQLLTMGVDAKSKARFSFLLGMAYKKDGNVEKARENFKNSMFGPYKPASINELEKLKGEG